MTKVKEFAFRNAVLMNKSPREFLQMMTNEGVIDVARAYTFIILGKSGPTGKTWLYEHLKAKGLNAFEISESIAHMIKRDYGHNHYYIDDDKKQVVIVLNKPLKKEATDV